MTFLESWAIWEKTQRDEDLETAKVKGEALVPKFDSIITELRMSKEFARALQRDWLMAWALDTLDKSRVLAPEG